MAPPGPWYCHSVVAGSLEPRVRSSPQALVLSIVPPSNVPTDPEAVPVTMTTPYTLSGDPAYIGSGSVQDIDVIETSTGWGVGVGVGVAVGVGDGVGVRVGVGVGADTFTNIENSWHTLVPT
jgi:hypothetical protein